MENHLAPRHWGFLYIGTLALITYLLLSIVGADPALAKVSVLNIGQGDAILIQTPEHKNILIDAGPNGDLVGELDKSLGFFNRKIDLFILSHPHRDHFMGMLDIMDKYPIKQIMITGVASDDELYINWLREVKKAKIPLLFPQQNQDWQLGNDLVLDILYPFSGQGLIGQEMKNKNNASVVALLREKNGKAMMLFTGDAEKEEERELLLSGQAVQSPVLKLGHHGSRTSSSEAFLNAVQPKKAVLSAGVDNSFKHPHPETLVKMKERGVELHRTDLNGAVRFVFR